jgi:virulence-associated protein VagC
MSDGLRISIVGLLSLNSANVIIVRKRYGEGYADPQRCLQTAAPDYSPTRALCGGSRLAAQAGADMAYVSTDATGLRDETSTRQDRSPVSQRAQSGGPDSRRIGVTRQDATIHQEGNRLVVEPVRKRTLAAILATLEPLEEDFLRLSIRIQRIADARNS